MKRRQHEMKKCNTINLELATKIADEIFSNWTIKFNTEIRIIRYSLSLIFL